MSLVWCVSELLQTASSTNLDCRWFQISTKWRCSSVFWKDYDKFVVWRFCLFEQRIPYAVQIVKLFEANLWFWNRTDWLPLNTVVAIITWLISQLQNNHLQQFQEFKKKLFFKQNAFEHIKKSMTPVSWRWDWCFSWSYIIVNFGFWLFGQKKILS